MSAFLTSTTLIAGRREPMARSSAHTHSAADNSLADRQSVSAKIKLGIVRRMMIASLNVFVIGMWHLHYKRQREIISLLNQSRIQYASY